MSFSNQVKKELSQVKLDSKLQALIELSSILKVNASISIRNAFINISFASESEHVVRRIYKLIDYIYDYEPIISQYKNNNIMKDGLFNITVEDEDVAKKIMADSGFDLFGNYLTTANKLFSRIKSVGENGYSAYLRGIFLGSGSVVDPNKNYHLELLLNNKSDLNLLEMVLNELKIDTLRNKRSGKYVVYIKNSEIISSFLLVIKAINSMLELENIKIEKDVRNNVNRRMNFDIANINKVIKTSMEQIKDIRLIESNNMMPDDLKDLANLRKEKPENSLRELAELLNPPTTKSNVAYKMNKIRKIAKDIRMK